MKLQSIRFEKFESPFSKVAPSSQDTKKPLRNRSLPLLLATVAMKDYERKIQKNNPDGSRYKKRRSPHREYMAINGLLSPKGDLYACLYKQHSLLAEALGYKQLWKMEDDGWCSLQQMQWRVQSAYMPRALTLPQKSVIKNWFIAHEFSSLEYLALIDESRNVD